MAEDQGDTATFEQPGGVAEEVVVERQPVEIPMGHLHAENVLDILRQIEVTVPESISSACAYGQPLWMAGEQLPAVLIDEALALHDVDEQAGSRLKDAMARLKILQA